MPYIITTHEHGERPGVIGDYDISRTAVATLEEARTAVADIVQDIADESPETGERIIDAFDIDPPGGTIGPLPDGTVIEVRHAEWIDVGIDPFDDEVNAEVDRIGGYSAERCAAALAAFNAA